MATHVLRRGCEPVCLCLQTGIRVPSLALSPYIRAAAWLRAGLPVSADRRETGDVQHRRRHLDVLSGLHGGYRRRVGGRRRPEELRIPAQVHPVYLPGRGGGRETGSGVSSRSVPFRGDLHSSGKQAYE